MQDHKFSFMVTLDFANWPPEKVAYDLSSIGYNGVEWTVSHWDPDRDPVSKLAEIVKITEKYGMKVSEFNVQRDLVTKPKEVRMRHSANTVKCIEGAAEVGIDGINVITGPASWLPEHLTINSDISEGEAWEIFTEAFDPILEAAEKNHVYLNLEAVFGNLCRDYYSTVELMRRFPSKWLALNFDPSHYVLYHNDIPWCIKQWGSKIRHVHMKDVVGTLGVQDRDFIFPLLGEGMMDWQSFFSALANIGYSGFYSVEYESMKYYEKILKNDPVRAAKLSFEQLLALSPS